MYTYIYFAHCYSTLLSMSRVCFSALSPRVETNVSQMSFIYLFFSFFFFVSEKFRSIFLLDEQGTMPDQRVSSPLPSPATRCVSKQTCFREKYHSEKSIRGYRYVCKIYMYYFPTIQLDGPTILNILEFLSILTCFSSDL